MNDDEIRKLVQAGLLDGALPRQTPVIAQLVIPGQPTPILMVGGSALPDPCVVCGGQTTQVRYNAPGGPIAFHERCHAIWREETDKLW